MNTQQAKLRLHARLRIDAGNDGYCLECAESIAPLRLELNPETPLCIVCAAKLD